MNKLLVSGNVTRNIEAKMVNTKRGAQAVANFDIAVNGHNNTTFFAVTAWGKTAELLSGTVKGTKLTIIGPVGIDEFNGRAKLAVTVDTFEFSSPRAQQAEAPAAAEAVYNPNVDAETGEIIADEDNEDLPW